jgi:pyrimidine deaminase RibD-like protein
MDPVEKYLNKAFKEAITGVRTNQGGPFGAVIVKDGTTV